MGLRRIGRGRSEVALVELEHLVDGVGYVPKKNDETSNEDHREKKTVVLYQPNNPIVKSNR